MEDGIFLLALPDQTLQIVRNLSKKMGKSFPDVISEAISILQERLEKQEEKIEETKKEEKPKSKIKFVR